MHWTLRRLRARDAWASYGFSQSLNFRWRLIKGDFALEAAELLRGGRWLFTIHHDGTAYMLDLGLESPQPQFLFRSYLSSERPLNKFHIWIEETKRELCFRVATDSFETAKQSQFP